MYILKNTITCLLRSLDSEWKKLSIVLETLCLASSFPATDDKKLSKKG